MPDGHAGALVELVRAIERGAPFGLFGYGWGLGFSVQELRHRSSATRARWWSWRARPSVSAC